MEDNKNNFTTNPVSILLSSFTLSVAILMHGGIIKVGNATRQAAATPAPQAAAPAAPAAPVVTLDKIKSLFNDKNLVYGKADAKNLLVEVADPSCPFCHVAAGKNPSLNTQMNPRFTLVSEGGTYLAPIPEMKKLVDSGEAAYVYIYSPGHGSGEMGTKALYCAKEKGKFWEVHDKLMTAEGYTLLNDQVKNDKAKSGELANFLASAANVTDMKSCLESGKYDAKIQEDTQIAISLGVSGTPGFFINTTNFAGAYSWTDMQSAVQK